MVTFDLLHIPGEFVSYQVFDIYSSNVLTQIKFFLNEFLVTRNLAGLADFANFFGFTGLANLTSLMSYNVVFDLLHLVYVTRERGSL